MVLALQNITRLRGRPSYRIMRMSSRKVLVVLVMTSSRREAGSIAKAVVKEKLAACVNMVPGVTSVFRWKGRVQISREVLLIMKTTVLRYSALEQRIRSLHSYQVPEILAVKIEKGAKQYIGWVQQETASG